MESAEQISNMLQLSPEQLYVVLGNALTGHVENISPDDEHFQAKIGQAWFASNLKTLQQAVCGSPSIRSIMKDERVEDRILLVSAIVDLLLGVSGIVSPVTVAVLIVKEGLETFCSRN